jgi:hypothetical protein|tara:strand:- start:1144 stop:1572 length:429 start_codon:yes stop_codon:yes gene_type:complete
MRQLAALGRTINKLAGVNIYQNTRHRPIIEARSLFSVIAYRYHNYTFEQIANFLISKGKTSDHSSVLHAYKNFDMYAQYSKHLIEWLEDIVGGTKNFNKQQLIKLVNHKISLLEEREINLIYDIVDNLYLTTLEVEAENENK